LTIDAIRAELPQGLTAGHPLQVQFLDGILRLPGVGLFPDEDGIRQAVADVPSFQTAPVGDIELPAFQFEGAVPPADFIARPLPPPGLPGFPLRGAPGPPPNHNPRSGGPRVAARPSPRSSARRRVREKPPRDTGRVAQGTHTPLHFAPWPGPRHHRPSPARR